MFEYFIKVVPLLCEIHLFKEKEGFLKANLDPLFGDNQYQGMADCSKLIVHSLSQDQSQQAQNKRHKIIFDFVSNRTKIIPRYYIKLRLVNSLKGGMIGWKNEIRLKHLGTQEYLCVSQRDSHDPQKRVSFTLTGDMKDPGTLFVFHPVDQVVF